jgi:hypothetical protein
MKHIWMYWENAPGSRGMPPFAHFCVESVRRHRGGAELHLLDERSVQEYLPDLRPEWHRLKKPAHKADYIRTRLVLHHGGMWLDCDMAALGPLEPLFHIPAPFDFACQDIGSAIGCFVAKPGCELLRKVTSAQDNVLDTSPQDFAWNAIGNELLKEFGASYPYHRWVEWTLDEVAHGKVTRLLSEREDLAKVVDPNAVVFHFCGNVLSPLLNTYARHRHQSLLGQRMLVSKILRRALGLPEPGFGVRLTNTAWMLDLGDGVARRLGLQAK